MEDWVEWKKYIHFGLFNEDSVVLVKIGWQLTPHYGPIGQGIEEVLLEVGAHIK